MVACASALPRSERQELIVEGDQRSYPAFEMAAKSCGFTSMVRKSDGRGGTHFNIFVQYPLTDADQCVMQWVERHPERD